MRPLQDVVNLRLTALCIADRLSCLYRSRDLVHHSFFPGSQIKGSNANRNNIKTDNISHTSGTGSPALLPSLASYCFMVTSGIIPAATPEGENLLSRDRNLFPEVENQVSGRRGHIGCVPCKML